MLLKFILYGRYIQIFYYIFTLLKSIYQNQLDKFQSDLDLLPLALDRLVTKTYIP